MGTVVAVIRRMLLTFYQHIDTVWLWLRSEGNQVVLSTYRSALDRLGDHPDITYVVTAAEHIRVVAEHDPGVIQIFRNTGKKAYVYLRPSDPHESNLPRVFWWQDSFGRRILAARLTEGYNAGPNTITPRILTCTADMEARDLPATLVLAGLGNHGGELGLDLIGKIEDLQTQHPIEYSTIDSYLSQIDLESLPTITGDKLKHHARGSYSANLGMKQQIRKTEEKLLAAEKMLAMLALTGLPEAPRIAKRHSDQLVEAWRTYYLPSLFHDLAAGTAIRAGHEAAKNDLAAAQSIARRAIDAAVQQITWNIKTPGNKDMTPVTVFNMNAHRAQIPTEFTIDSHILTQPRLVDANGKEVVCQRILSDSITSSRKRFGFAADVPAFGYATYWLSQASEVAGPFAEAATDTMIRTDLLEVHIDKQTGQISRLLDRRTGLEGPSLEAIVLKDESDTWSHDVAGYTEILGGFGHTTVKLVENGPWRAVIKSHSRFETSSLVQEYIVYRGQATVEIRSKLLWTGRRQVLKMDYRHQLCDVTVAAEGSYGFNIDRDAGEQPVQKWLSVNGVTADGVKAGFALITDSLHAYDAPEGHVRLTVLRSPVYAHHDPQVLRSEQLDFYDWMDQGEHHFKTLITLGPDAAEVYTVSEAAALFNQPPVNLVLTLRPTATLAQTASFAEIYVGKAQIAACLRSQKDDGWTVRVFNPAPHAVTVTLRFGERHISLLLAASAFKTVIVPDKPGAIRQVRILE